jgi:ammonia channel protein AmtB
MLKSDVVLFKMWDCVQARESYNFLCNHVGTVFLWMYWPSFNSVLVTPAVDQQRAVINTYLSLVACCVTTFAVSALINKDRKLDMV